MKYLLPIIFVLAFSACTKEKAGQTSVETKKAQGPLSVEGMTINEDGLSNTKAIIKTVHGNITFKFYPQKAPNTIRRIVELIQSGFYDGLSFHRVVPGFVVQTGDPTGTGRGGSGKKLKAEFNDIQHVKGTVAMARSNDPDSADSQFYICLATASHLDSKYTVFGQVVDGLDVLSKIQKGEKIVSLVIIE